jgi:hypothetical protein
MNPFIEFDGIKVSAEDAELAYSQPWRINNHGYVIGRDGVLLHRLILKAPIGVFVDHENGDPRDNRRENIRLCTRTENAWNRRMHSNNACGHPNVYRDGEWWVAQVKANKQRHRKRFRTLEEAAEFARELVKTLHGDFAKSLREIKPQEAP